MSDETTVIKISIMTIGKTPSNFDPKYNGQISCVCRSVLGLGYENTTGNQLCVVFELPKPHDGLKYGYCGMSVDELKQLEKGISTTNHGGDKFQLVWDERYPSCNKDALAEIIAEAEAGE